MGHPIKPNEPTMKTVQIRPKESDVKKIFRENEDYLTREYFQLLHLGAAKRILYDGPHPYQASVSNAMQNAKYDVNENGSIKIDLDFSPSKLRQGHRLYELLGTVPKTINRELTPDDFSIGIDDYEKFKSDLYDLSDKLIKLDEPGFHLAYFIKLILGRKVLPDVGVINYPMDEVQKELDEIDKRKTEIVKGIDIKKLNAARLQDDRIKAEKKKILEKYDLMFETYSGKQWQIKHERERLAKNQNAKKERAGKEPDRPVFQTAWPWTTIKSLRGIVYKSWIDRLLPFFITHPKVGNERESLILIGLLFHLAGFNELFIRWTLKGHSEEITEDEPMKKKSFAYYLANTFRKINWKEVQIMESPIKMTILQGSNKETEILSPPLILGQVRFKKKRPKKKKKGKQAHKK